MYPFGMCEGDRDLADLELEFMEANPGWDFLNHDLDDYDFDDYDFDDDFDDDDDF